MACRGKAIAGSLRVQRLARALATRAVEAARLLALVGLTTVVLLQPALTQERRDPPAIALQPSPQRSVPGHLQRTIDSLATRAKQAFCARMEPVFPKLIMCNIVVARRVLSSFTRVTVVGTFHAA